MTLEGYICIAMTVLFRQAAVASQSAENSQTLWLSVIKFSLLES